MADAGEEVGLAGGEDGAVLSEGSATEEDVVSTDSEAEYREVELAKAGGRRTVNHEHWEVVRHGIMKAMFRLDIQARGRFSEEECEDVLEYLSMKGVRDAVIDGMTVMVMHAARTIREADVSRAGGGDRRRAAGGHDALGAPATSTPRHESAGGRTADPLNCGT